MRIESVRALKAELTSGLEDNAVAESFAVLRDMAANVVGAVGSPRRMVSKGPALPNGVVLGVSPGEGDKGGRKLAVRFQEQSEEAARFGHYIVGKARGEVDIQFVGQVFAGRPAKGGSGEYQNSQRPLRNGYSIGHYLVTAGTLGCFVKNKSGTVGVLSNNHVLGNINRA